MRLLIYTLFMFNVICVHAQTTIPMKPYHGVYKIPCKVNGISLDFIFDTGASKVSLSSTEAMFMYKNGIIKSSDFGEAVTFSVADGKSLVGMNLTLRSVKIGRKILYDVPATVVNSENAPLLLGQSVLSELGVIQFDYNDNTLTFYNDESSIPDIGNFYEMREQKMNDYEVVLRKNKKELDKLKAELNINSQQIEELRRTKTECLIANRKLKNTILEITKYVPRGKRDELGL